MSGGQSAFACLPRVLDPHHIASVKASTFRCYQQCLRLFVIFLIESGANPGSAAELDLLILQYKASCHLSHSKLEQLIAALEFHLLPLKGLLPYSKRVAKGLCRVTSIRHTLPLLSGPAKLFGVLFVAAGFPCLAIGLVVQCLTGLRPSELLGLREQDVLRPTAACPKFVFRLGVGCGTKVRREQVASLHWGRDPVVARVLQQLLYEAEPESYLFNVSYAQYRGLLARAEAYLGLEKLFTPHSPRAGFATEEFFTGLRRGGHPTKGALGVGTVLQNVPRHCVRLAGSSGFSLTGSGRRAGLQCGAFWRLFPAWYFQVRSWLPPCWTLMASKSQYRPSFLFQPPLLGAGYDLPGRTRQGPHSAEPPRVRQPLVSFKRGRLLRSPPPLCVALRAA